MDLGLVGLEVLLDDYAFVFVEFVDYAGAEMFLAVVEGAETDDDADVAAGLGFLVGELLHMVVGV